MVLKGCFVVDVLQVRNIILMSICMLRITTKIERALLSESVYPSAYTVNSGHLVKADTSKQSGHVELVPVVLQSFTLPPSKTDTSLRRCLHGRRVTLLEGAPS